MRRGGLHIKPYRIFTIVCFAMSVIATNRHHSNNSMLYASNNYACSRRNRGHAKGAPPPSPTGRERCPFQHDREHTAPACKPLAASAAQLHQATVNVCRPERTLVQERGVALHQVGASVQALLHILSGGHAANGDDGQVVADFALE